MDIVTLALAMKNGGVSEEALTSMISEQIADVVDGAPENFDTLKEISDWIDTHSEEYASLLSSMSDLETATVNETIAYLEESGVIAPNAEEEEF